MKILILLDERWDSGITNYALQAACALKAAQNDVWVGVLPGKKPEKLAADLKLKTVPMSSYLALRKFLKQNPVDVINPHTGSTHTWSVFSQAFKSQKYKKIPIVRTRGDARELRTNALAQFIYSRTQGVIAASDHVRKQYELGFGMNEQKARTIYPAVTVDENIVVPDLLSVGILGRLDPVKGHAFFLEAASKVLKTIPGALFLIAGREANVSYDVLKNQADQLGIADAVQFLGFQQSARAFMQRCRLGVIASIGSEEVSRACLEWMSVGRPVVGTLVGCLPELIEPRETGLLVPPADSSALGDAITTILNDDDVAGRWGAQAHFVASKRFNEKNLLEKTMRMFEWVQ